MRMEDPVEMVGKPEPAAHPRSGAVCEMGSDDVHGTEGQPNGSSPVMDGTRAYRWGESSKGLYNKRDRSRNRPGDIRSMAT